MKVCQYTTYSSESFGHTCTASVCVGGGGVRAEFGLNLAEAICGGFGAPGTERCLGTRSYVWLCQYSGGSLVAWCHSRWYDSW